MRTQIDAHTLERAAERGASEAEIRDVILTGEPIPAKKGRLGKAKVYPFGQVRLGKRYEQKRVEVFYSPSPECPAALVAPKPCVGGCRGDEWRGDPP